MEPISEIVQAYSAKYTSAESEALSRIAESTMQTHEHAHMLSGHVQGKFLEIISLVMQPMRVLEIGTFTGYSAICLSRGLREGGQVHTIEIRPEDAELSLKNFNLAGVQDKIILHAGSALEIIPLINEMFDLVYIDADKTGYVDYYKLVLPKLRKGGIILADNVLYHGQVLAEKVSGKNALAIQAFNEFVRNDDSVEKVLLTIRDGLLMIIKK